VQLPAPEEAQTEATAKRVQGRHLSADAQGREVQTDNRAKEIEIPLQATTPEVDDAEQNIEEIEDGLTDPNDDTAIPLNVRMRKATRPTPPRTFSYGASGGIYSEIKERDATGVEVKTQVQVLPHDLFVVDILRMEEKEHCVHLISIKTIGASDAAEGKPQVEYTPIIMPTKAAVSRDELLKCLAANNVYAAQSLRYRSLAQQPNAADTGKRGCYLDQNQRCSWGTLRSG